MNLREGKRPRAVAAQLELLEGTDVLELNILLQDCEPKVERTILVHAASTFAHLHEVIQTAMGWEDAHLHEFMVGKTRIGMEPEDDFFADDEMLLEEEARLIDLLPGTKGKFSYTYDFGDDWRHAISVKKVWEAAELEVHAPYCVNGSGACPPEDCGGTWGYMETLEVLRSGTKARKAELLEWLGAPIDPERFDLDDVNKKLERLKKP